FVVRVPSIARPAVDAEPLSRAGARAAEPAANGPAANGVRRVLLVEDNIDVRTTLADLLRLWGYEVHLAGNGDDALEIAVRVRPQAVLIDVGLPGMSGYEVARRLRPPADGLERRALLIAITGYGRDQDRSEGKRAG